MRKTAQLFITSASAAVLLGTLSVAAPAIAAGNLVEEGKKVAFDRKKGNCLACHQIAGGDLAGNIGPPLIAMKARFPNKAVLREQIADATIKNPNSIMPPFGRHGALSDAEIDAIVEFVYTL